MEKHFNEYQQILELANKVGNKEISDIVLDNIYDDMLDKEIHTYTQASMIVEDVKGKKKSIK
jgi:hypothetical protein